MTDEPRPAARGNPRARVRAPRGGRGAAGSADGVTDRRLYCCWPGFAHAAHPSTRRGNIRELAVRTAGTHSIMSLSDLPFEMPDLRGKVAIVTGGAHDPRTREYTDHLEVHTL
eukprot:COSAG03_NODE_11520_length_588_cov_1.163599_1_plen_113_part_00